MGFSKKPNTLKLLEAIELDGTKSQRELSKQLRLSLGSVNALIREMVDKGYVRIVSGEKNKGKYRVTVRGVSRKAALTWRLIIDSLQYYRYLKGKIRELIESLVRLNAEDIVICGTNEICEITCILLHEYDLNLVAIIDNDRAGQTIMGLKVSKMSFLKDNHCDAIIWTSTEIALPDLDTILELDVSPEKIHSIRKFFDRALGETLPS